MENDEVFLKIYTKPKIFFFFDYLKSENWCKLSKKEKKKFFVRLNKMICETLKIKKIELIVNDDGIKKHQLSSDSVYKNIIVDGVNRWSINDIEYNQYLTLYEYLLRLRKFILEQTIFEDYDLTLDKKKKSELIKNLERADLGDLLVEIYKEEGDPYEDYQFINKESREFAMSIVSKIIKRNYIDENSSYDEEFFLSNTLNSALIEDIGTDSLKSDSVVLHYYKYIVNKLSLKIARFRESDLSEIPNNDLFFVIYPSIIKNCEVDVVIKAFNEIIHRIYGGNIRITSYSKNIFKIKDNTYLTGDIDNLLNIVLKECLNDIDANVRTNQNLLDIDIIKNDGLEKAIIKYKKKWLFKVLHTIDSSNLKMEFGPFKQDTLYRLLNKENLDNILTNNIECSSNDKNTEINSLFKKIKTDLSLKKKLKKIIPNIWENLSIEKQMELIKDILNCFGSYYPEFGDCNVNFSFLDSIDMAFQIDDNIFINIDVFNHASSFEILQSCLHELRHFFQQQACELYVKGGIVHELFKEEQLQQFIENGLTSKLDTVSNYIHGSYFTLTEYELQPVEYDAEEFAFEFMRVFSDEILTDANDKDDCRFYCEESFSRLKQVKEGDKGNIINFNDIYKYIYQDRISNNRAVINKEATKYEDCLKLINKIDVLSEEKIMQLINPPIWEKIEESVKIKILNAYLSFYSEGLFVNKVNDKIYINNREIYLNDSNIFFLMENVFLAIADYKISNILSKEDRELKWGYEKDIKINLGCRNNIISEKRYPLFYRMQPYILYRDHFMYDSFLKLIKSIDTVHDESDNYFLDFRELVEI